MPTCCCVQNTEAQTGSDSLQATAKGCCATPPLAVRAPRFVEGWGRSPSGLQGNVQKPCPLSGTQQAPVWPSGLSARSRVRGLWERMLLSSVPLGLIPVCWCPSSWHRPGVNTPRINPRSPRLGPLLPPAAHTQDETFRALFCWGAELRRLSPPPQPWPAKDAEAGAGVRLSYRGLCGGRFPVPSHSPALAGPIGFDEEKQACGVGTQQEGIELDWSPLGGSSQALRTPFP